MGTPPAAGERRATRKYFEVQVEVPPVEESRVPKKVVEIPAPKRTRPDTNFGTTSPSPVQESIMVAVEPAQEQFTDYTVQKGDTIESIAKKWKGDVNEIIQFNDLSPNQTLVVGSIIIIPNGEAPLLPSYTPRGTYRGGSGPEYVGYYRRPIVGGRKSQGLHGYNGVDLANFCGTPIVASASGDVIISRSGGWNGGYGNFVIIDHYNGTQTLYAHMSSVIVSAGWHVVQGQVIGYIGLSGNTTGCHIHFEIRGAKNLF